MCRILYTNHCLINAVMRMGVVVPQKPLFHCRDDGLHLLQAMEARLIPQRQSGVVSKVEVPEDLLKPLACDP